MSEGKIPIRRPATDIPTTATPQEKPKYPTDVVDLPTKGWFYDESNPLSNGTIELKQMTAREEDILANQDLIRKGKVLDKLLESIVVDKSINPKDIFIPDKNAIFVTIRRLAYGDSYKVNVTCPACGSRNEEDINLGDLREKEVDVSTMPRGQNKFYYTLPKSNIKITYKLLNQKDEDEIEKELAGYRKINKENSRELTTRLKYLITSVDENGDTSVIRKFVDEQLSAFDSRALREHIRDNTTDIDMKFDFKCSNCELERRLDVPVGASFLWPDIES